MRYVMGKNMKIEGADLDALHRKLVAVVRECFPVGGLKLDEIVEEWVNDLLYLAGYAELDEVKPLEG
jgi:hypothetical protein